MLYCDAILCYIMLYYDRIELSEGININKTSALKECDIFHYCHFLDKGFKFQPDVCNGYHDVLMMSVNLNDIAILNIRDVDYRCIINGIDKKETASLLQNANLTEERGVL